MAAASLFQLLNTITVPESAFSVVDGTSNNLRRSRILSFGGDQIISGMINNPTGSDPTSNSLFIVAQSRTGDFGYTAPVEVATGFASNFGGGFAAFTFGSPNAAGQEAGGVVWLELQADGSYDLRFQRFTFMPGNLSIGTEPLFLEGGATTLMTGIGGLLDFNFASNSSSFVVCASLTTPTGDGVIGALAYDASGNPIGSPTFLSSDGAGTSPQIFSGTDPAGSYVYGYVVSDPSGTKSLTFRTFDPASGATAPLATFATSFDTIGSMSYRYINTNSQIIAAVSGTRGGQSYVDFELMNADFTGAVTTFEMATGDASALTSRIQKIALPNSSKTVWAFSAGTQLKIVELDGTGAFVTQWTQPIPAGSVFDAISALGDGRFEVTWRSADASGNDSFVVEIFSPTATGPVWAGFADGAKHTFSAIPANFDPATTVVSAIASLPAGVTYDAATKQFVVDTSVVTLAAGAQMTSTISYSLQTTAGDGTVTTVSASESYTLVGARAHVVNTAMLANDTGASQTDGVTTDPTLSGVTDPGAEIGVYIEGQGFIHVQADKNGAWSYTPTGLSLGKHTIQVSEDIVSSRSDNWVNFGSVSFDLVASDAPIVPVTLDPLTGDTDHDGRIVSSQNLVVSGKAAPGASISLSIDDGMLVVTTVAGADGVWSWASPGPAPTGTHRLTATATDQAGKVTSATAIATVSPLDGTGSRVTDVPDGKGSRVMGVLDDTGTTLDIGAGTAVGTLTLSGGTILGGTIVDHGGGLAVSEAGELSGVTALGDLDVSGSGTLMISNGLSLRDAAGTGPGAMRVTGSINLQTFGDATLDEATITFAGMNGGGISNVLSWAGGAPTPTASLTFGSGLSVDVTDAFANFTSSGTIDNQGHIDVAASASHFSYASIVASTFVNEGFVTATNPDDMSNSWISISAQQIVNSGQILLSGNNGINLSANSPNSVIANTGSISVTNGGQIYFNTTTIDNAGTISGDGAYFQFNGKITGDGAFDVYNSFVSLQFTGTTSDFLPYLESYRQLTEGKNDTLRLYGTVDNTDAMLDLAVIGARAGGLTIDGGTVVDSGAGAPPFEFRLYGVTLGSDLSFGSTSYTTIRDGLQFSDPSEKLTVSSAYLHFEGTQTIGGGEIDVKDSWVTLAPLWDWQTGVQTAGSLTLDAGMKLALTGSSVTLNLFGSEVWGNIAAPAPSLTNLGSIESSASSVGLFGDRMVNQGRIDVLSGSTFFEHVETFDNAGGEIDVAKGAKAHFGEASTTFWNDGVVRIENGGVAKLSGYVVGKGTIEVQAGGTLQIDDSVSGWVSVDLAGDGGVVEFLSSPEIAEAGLRITDFSVGDEIVVDDGSIAEARYDAGKRILTLADASGTALETIAIDGGIADGASFRVEKTFDGKSIVDLTTAAPRVSVVKTLADGSIQTSWYVAGALVEVDWTGIVGQKYDRLTTTYDAGGKLAEQVATRGGQLVFDTTYVAGVLSHAVVTALNGNAYVADYDAAGRVTHTVYADGSVVDSAYGSYGKLATTIRSSIVGQKYDTLTTTYGTDGKVAEQVARRDGQLVFDKIYTAGVLSHAVFTALDGVAYAADYDKAGRVIHAVYADGTVLDTTYGADGKVASTTKSSIAGQKYDTLTTIYGSDGKVAEQVAMRGGQLVFDMTYAAGVLSHAVVTALNGSAYVADYDAAGRVVHTAYADGLVVDTTYGADGKLAATTRSSIVGQKYDTLTTTYGADGKVAEQVAMRGGQLVFDKIYAAGVLSHAVFTALDGNAYTADYDAAGRAIHTVNADGTVLDTIYGAGGKVASTTKSGILGQKYDTLTTTYGSDGKVAEVVGTRGGQLVFDMTYAAGVLSHAVVTALNGNAFVADYDAVGRVVHTVYADGRSVTYGRNADGTYEMETTGLTASTYDTTQVFYGANGKILSEVWSKGGVATRVENWTAAGAVVDNVALDKPATDAAPFGGKSSIDLRAFDPTKTTLGFTEDASNTFGTLTLTSGSEQLALTLFGQYTAASFTMASDGSGGTILSRQNNSPLLVG